MAAISSLHSTVRLIDTRTGRKMVVALSNGTLVLLDARTGRLASLSHGNPTHATAHVFVRLKCKV
ncbi:unnamed protein product [Nippostrongylus brasiliensis]|uniref:WD_REPEATS_REGION domain-containing protein n=1 Tax=Nippostrongylus brasiliensis TaxID=27835 RepID=A0A0N4XRN2_NIPBR|nr:unnamed protein product [Nippostrongylus brasiliensis]